MSDAIIAEAQSRLAKAGKNARMRLKCTDILALAGVEQAAPEQPAPAPEPTPEPEPTPTPEPTPDPDAINYGAMLKDALIAECEARGLPTDGNKADLVARLEEHDASEPDDGE